VVRGTFFLGYEIRGHGEIEGHAVMVMRMVLVNLETYSIRGVGTDVDVEVVLPDWAMLSRGSPPARSRFRLQRHSAFGLFLQVNHVTAGQR
jgi:hypothetical protein